MQCIHVETPLHVYSDSTMEWNWIELKKIKGKMKYKIGLQIKVIMDHM